MELLPGPGGDAHPEAGVDHVHVALVLLLVLVVTVRPLLELALVLLVTPSPGLRDLKNILITIIFINYVCDIFTQPLYYPKIAQPLPLS